MILFNRRNKTRVLLFGGLGNQLFQISTGFAVAGERQLILDISYINPAKNPNWFNSYQDLKIADRLELERNSRIGAIRSRMINLAIRLSTQNFEDPRLKRIRVILTQIYSLTLQLWVFKGQRVFISRGVGAQLSDLNKLQGHVLIGYFQSYHLVHPKSPNNVLERVRVLLGVSDSRSTDTRDVAIQFRLGDYEENSQIGVLNVSYFRRALSILVNELEVQSAVVFSDDIEKALDLLAEISDLEFRDGENSTRGAVPTLVAMSNYSYFVISNSTFAWWAASLSTNATKVIVPYPWFSGSDSPSMIIPPDWIKVSRDS